MQCEQAGYQLFILKKPLIFELPSRDHETAVQK
jgi:hypothetical protein